jgi:hypothetical protein
VDGLKELKMRQGIAYCGRKLRCWDGEKNYTSVS